ncbi:hypothetical protein QC763_305115 [Podospora pseudopauciseta]|uniref:Uncharacterized protein n=1 Tax=Podospora pseudopauciseta TaxID=2093780 RepID=A0ABR0HGI5_9PEZI|nr:hypothetical protein QC763_305115 [Podospora pseudopauciseta]
MRLRQRNMETVQYLESQAEEITPGVRVHNGATVDEPNAVIVWLKKPLDNAVASARAAEALFDETSRMVEGEIAMHEQMNKNQHEANAAADEGHNEHDAPQQRREVQPRSTGVCTRKNELLVLLEGMHTPGRIQGLIDALGPEPPACSEISFEGMGDVEAARKQAYSERKSYTDKILHIKKRDGHSLW